MKNLVISAAFSAACVLGSLANPASAAVRMGDTPSIHIKVYGSKDSRKTVDLSAFRGQIVIVDFWGIGRSGGGDDELHLVDLNHKYAAKGLQILGVSLMSDPTELGRYILDKELTWPIMYEPNGRSAQTVISWGVDEIPTDFIIGPDGTVLWRGNTADLDQHLEEAFKDHAPGAVDPKTLAAATATLDKIEAALTAKQPNKALKLLADIPPAAAADPSLTDRVKTATDALQTYGVSELAKVDPLVEAKNYTDATAKLVEISKAFAALPVGAQAKQKLTDLQANPYVKAEMEASQSAKESTEDLAAAKKLQENKQDELAYARFKTIVKVYPGTPAATEAADAVKTYEADAAFMAKINNKGDNNKAQGTLSLADSYKASGKTDLARKKYQEVIDQYPDTTWAKTAKKGLASLNE